LACLRMYAALTNGTNPSTRLWSHNPGRASSVPNILGFRGVPGSAAALLALLLDLVERLREPLECILIGRLRAAAGRAFHRQVGALAHGIDHARFLGDILDPGTVVLRVHRELGGADLGGGVRTRSERIPYDDRYLVFYLVGGPGGNEQVRGTARTTRGLHCRGLRLGKREAELVAAGRGGIRAPVGVFAE